MSLNASKTILKVFGIISIIFGILGILFGIIAIAGGSIIGAGAAGGEIATDSKLSIAVVFLGLGGLVLIIMSVIDLLSGIFSVKAAKDISKIMPAWVFALLDFISSLIGLIFVLIPVIQKTQAIETNQITSTIIGLLISILIFVAANTIKKEAGK